VSALPFPYASLERLTRSEMAAGAKLRRFLRASVRPDALAAAASDVTKKRISVIDRGIRRLDPARSTESAAGILLAAADGGTPALVEIEAALAGALLSSAIGRAAPRVVDLSRPAPPEISGAVGAVIVALARRAHRDVALRVVAAGPAYRIARDFAGAHPDATTAWLTVLVDDDAFEARVSVPSSALPAADFEVDVEAALGLAPVAIPLVVLRAIASRGEIRALEPGDAFVVPGKGIATKSGALVGPVMLVPPRGELGIGADLAEGGRLVLRGRIESSPWDPAMSDEAGTTTKEVLEDASVVVRVELGSVEMKAAEWAALGPGDVVVLGRRVGDPAILRVGGVEVARGELVQVDGELGVKIIGRGSR
jgi:flagellar motor switch/type III secretory pathway protein FliN